MKQFQCFLFATVFAILFTACNSVSRRQVISLNGEWQIAKTSGDVPDVFNSVAPVPGLVDLAVPGIDSAATLYKDGWYWHRRSFNLESTDYEKIILKIFKAKYHTKVYVNGQYTGENLYCFTPSYFDIKPFLLSGQANELIIGVGCVDQLPDTIPEGHDFEKLKYIPGIYDNVELILSNKPYINNIQCVPDIVGEKLRVVAEIETDRTEDISLEYIVSEVNTKKEIRKSRIRPVAMMENGMAKVDFEIDMKDAMLWSPESPFLYELELSTGADHKKERFGMRSFRFDTEKGLALLNGKPYYMRGTNVCIFRFFEDPERSTLPWDEKWTIDLHEKFKDMYWNTMRYCIGFPPERWYEVCDSLGFMLQDEFPIWYGHNIGKIRPNLTSRHIVEEYTRWMRERWNHPSVVIWDAQNETVTPEIAAAINQVRGLDRSNRPWENGWSDPASAADVLEAHPYRFSRYRGQQESAEGYRKDIFGKPTRADNDANSHSQKVRETGVLFPNPLLINEYGWIWLNRDGSTTTLTDQVYDVLWDGKNLTSERRLEIYARHLAMLTEYWRAHRQVTGVLHFCGLGYSRPDEPRGQTSDHWINLQNLVYEPNFYRYVKPSFAPVGLMIDFWEKAVNPGAELKLDVYAINDLDTPFTGNIKLRIIKDGKEISMQEKEVSISPLGREIPSFTITVPDEKGEYQMEASINLNDEEVKSIRDLKVGI